MVGEEVTITIDYDVLGLEAEKPTGVVNAYVGPAIKIFPVGIPEDAKKLLVTDNEDWTYTAIYTFNQAGTDTLYITDGCADCPVCEYEITVVPIPPVPCPVPVITLSDDTPMVDQVIEITFSYIDSVTKPVEAGTDLIYVTDLSTDCLPYEFNVTVDPTVCPEITIAGEEEWLVGSGDWYVAGGSHEITIVFAIPTVDVRLFADHSLDLMDDFGNIFINMDANEIELSTADGGLTYTGTWVFGGEQSGDCDTTWLTVLVGEGCCPEVCSRTVIVDEVDPYAGFGASFDTCEVAGTCPPYDAGHILAISILTDPNECLADCCGDVCTAVDEWTIEIFNFYEYGGDEVEPYDDCCVRQAVDACDIFDVVTGSGCDTLGYTTICIADEWEVIKYKVIITLEDIVGNTTVYNGILDIDTTNHTAFVINATDISEDCQTWTGTSSSSTILGYDCYEVD
jgi:hypothetical protein